MIGARYEIKHNEVPRVHHDVLETAIGMARHGKMRNIKDSIKLTDLQTRRYAIIYDDVQELVWRDAEWEPAANIKPL